MIAVTPENIAARAAQAAFGRPLVTNVHRGLVVEVIVAFALEPLGWTWCSGDYGPWDFEHSDGTRLEVKQSASRQSWAFATGSGPSRPGFDIAPRKGRWDVSGKWIDEPGRQAHLYVFAHHPVFDDSANHRDPDQWIFHVVDAAVLPPARCIALKRLQTLAHGVSFQALGQRVEDLRQHRLNQSSASALSPRPLSPEVHP